MQLNRPCRHTSAIPLAAAAFGLLLARPAMAGAWPQAKGETFTISKITLTGAPHAYDLTGKIQGGTGFKKTELEVYTEHGLREHVTLIGKITWQDTIAGDVRQRGFASFEVGALAHLWTFDDASILSAQVNVILPGREEDKTNPLITSGHADYELRLLQGTPETFFEIPGFTDMQLAYRHRGGGPADELRADLTYGFDINPQWLLILQSQTITSIGDSDPPFQPYRSTKLLGSLRWQFDMDRYVELGGLQTIAGANTVRESGAFCAFWATF